MRLLFLLLLTGILFCLEACKKQGVLIVPVKQSLSVNAETYFNAHIAGGGQDHPIYDPSNIRLHTDKSVSWKDALETTFLGMPAVVAPIKYAGDLFYANGANTYYRADLFSRLLMYKDSADEWHTELVLLLPDSFYLSGHTRTPSGNIMVEDWWGQPLQKFHYSNGKVYQWNQSGLSKNMQQSISVNAIPKSTSVISTCTYVEGYNYSPDDPDGGEYWEENLGCEQTLVSEFELVNTATQYGKISTLPVSGGGSGGGTKVSVPAAPEVSPPPPTNIIKDIASYLHCYSNISGATYQVRICADQPDPGTRVPWTFAPNNGSSDGQNPVDVGHAFIILTEEGPGGTAIQRSVGYYPGQSCYPWSDPVSAVLNNDETHDFDISGAFSVNWDQFNAMLAYIMAAQTGQYQVNSTNCASFSVGVLAAGGVYFPQTIGTWAGGKGLDPGDVGEDIRSLTTIIPGMTRYIGSFDHLNTGTCN